MSGWWVVVYALAVARLTGLVTADVITEPARTRLIHHLGRPVLTGIDAVDDVQEQDEIMDQLQAEKHTARWTVAKLATCPWCVSIYIGAAVAALAWWHAANPWLAIPALALAFSFVAGALSDLGRS